MDANTLCACQLYLCKQLVGLAELGGAHQLKVGNFKLNAGLKRYFDHLVESLENALILVAHMNGKYLVVLCNYLCDFNYLVGIAEAAGRIDKAEGHACSTLLEHFVQQVAHFLKLSLGHLTHFPADHAAAESAVSDKRTNVDGNAVFLNVLFISGHITGSVSVLVGSYLNHAALAAEVELKIAVIHRYYGNTALTYQLKGNAADELRLHSGGRKIRYVRMAVDIDKTRSYHMARRVVNDFGGLIGICADLCDLAILDIQSRIIGLCSGSVNDETVFDYSIKHSIILPLQGGKLRSDEV